jgi:hypothetical protein
LADVLVALVLQRARISIVAGGVGSRGPAIQHDGAVAHLTPVDGVDLPGRQADALDEADLVGELVAADAIDGAEVPGTLDAVVALIMAGALRGRGIWRAEVEGRDRVTGWGCAVQGHACVLGGCIGGEAIPPGVLESACVPLKAPGHIVLAAALKPAQSEDPNGHPQTLHGVLLAR